jgi:hypothetical protein
MQSGSSVAVADVHGNVLFQEGAHGFMVPFPCRFDQAPIGIGGVERRSQKQYRKDVAH